jgi:DNA-binding NarL/FixJ family response regulator
VDLAARARLLTAETDQVAESLARSLWEKVPGYEMTALDRTELIAAIRASVEVILSCLADSRLPRDSELEPARTLGERRAIQGVPIESVVRSWHNAERFFIERLLGVDENMSAADAHVTNRRVAVLVDRMADVASTAYLDVLGEVQAHFSQGSADIVSSLAGAEPLEPAELERRARLIGAAPHLPHRVVALGTGGADGLALTKARRLVAETLRPHTMGRILAGSHRGHEVLLVTDHTDIDAVVHRAMARSGLPSDLHAGLGEPRPRLAEASGSLLEAISALEVALILDRRVARFEQVVPEVLLRESPISAQTMVRAVLGPLEQGDLLETLESFLASGLSMRATARRLHVHENTVAYRMKRIVEALGVEHVNDLVRADILLALRARQLFTNA